LLVQYTLYADLILVMKQLERYWSKYGWL